MKARERSTCSTSGTRPANVDRLILSALEEPSTSVTVPVSALVRAVRRDLCVQDFCSWVRRVNGLPEKGRPWEGPGDGDGPE